MPIRYPTSRPRKHETEFREVVDLIRTAKTRVYRGANVVLLDLYWEVGALISRKIQQEGWGKGTVKELSDYVCQHEPRARGFSSQNLWRMRQFYEFYQDKSKLSALLRELSWTQNLLILSKCKSSEEREFYVQMTLRERWSKRELERQIDGCLFERQSIKPAKLSPVVRELYPSAAQAFKDSYSRTLSPALVAEYETRLPNRRLLQAKLHELLQLAEAAGEYRVRAKSRKR